MAKGSILKQEITNKILETFPGSFLYNNGKEIRICGNENGELLQIKVALTCAKENVEVDSDNNVSTIAANNVINDDVIVEPTQEEKDNVRRLMEALNL
jgi:hypothetical protein